MGKENITISRETATFCADVIRAYISLLCLSTRDGDGTKEEQLGIGTILRKMKAQNDIITRRAIERAPQRFGVNSNRNIEIWRCSRGNYHTHAELAVRFHLSPSAIGTILRKMYELGVAE
jgi:hypothetical protein